MATLVMMPRLSPTMEEGVLAKWTKKEGDAVSPGDVIAEVETDKANMDFPLEEEGVLLKLLVREGDTVKLGDPVAVLGEAGEDPAEAIAQAGKAAPQPAPAATAAPAPAPPAPEVATPAATPAAPAPVAAPAPAAPEKSLDTNGQQKASPLARKLAAERGLDITRIAGSGPGGRVIKRDVLAAAEAPQAEPTPITARAEAPAPTAPPSPAFVPGAPDELVQPSQMRKAIARRLTEAKRDVPHIYLTAEASVDRLFELRQQINEQVEASGIKVSINDLVVKAMAMALRQVPDANVSWTPEGIVRHHRVDVGVAVSLPDNGLITPVVRSADLKSIGAMSTEIKSLAERARAKKLKPEEFAGGVATVSNLGMYGVREFCAIINPPESVILAVGATEKRAIVVEKEGRDEVVIARRMLLTLSCDHRVVDGVLGAQLLSAIVKLLEKPMGLLV
jgi:pyruvate dehydrogenase E2 component (dihydrolipoamide acetyltransferase)